MSFGYIPTTSGGAGGAQSYAVLRNNNNTSDINTATATELPFSTATEEFTSSDFTLNGNGLECNFDGKVLAQCSVYMYSTIQRASVGLTFWVNGAAATIPNEGAMGYIRASSGHNGSSVLLSQIFEVTSGDIISIAGIQRGLTGTTVMEGTGTNQSSFQLTRIP